MQMGSLFMASSLVLAAVACEPADTPAPQPERVALDEVREARGEASPSPDTTNARWSVAPGEQAIAFGNEGASPFLTLECDLEADPIEMVIIRHADAFPGQSALFPFVGNGMRSRFLADAVLHESGEGREWRWEARLPASDPQFDVFEGTRDFTATLPGHGMLEIGGSRMPGEFLAWCRAGGEVDQPEEPPEESED